MFKLPVGWLIGGGVGAALLILLTISSFALKATKAELALALERETRWVEQQTLCEENQTKLEVALAEVTAKSEENVILTARLQGSTDATHGQALELAKATLALDALDKKYKNLSTRAVDLDVCQTYELALAALAGGTQ